MAARSENTGWLTAELGGLLPWIVWPPVPESEERKVLTDVVPLFPAGIIDQLFSFLRLYRQNEELSAVTLRQLIRLGRRLAGYRGDLHHELCRILLLDQLPLNIRQDVHQKLEQAGIRPSSQSTLICAPTIRDNAVQIGGMVVQRQPHHQLVPDIQYYDNPRHTSILHSMLQVS